MQLQDIPVQEEVRQLLLHVPQYVGTAKFFPLKHVTMEVKIPRVVTVLVMELSQRGFALEAPRHQHQHVLQTAEMASESAQKPVMTGIQLMEEDAKQIVLEK